MRLSIHELRRVNLIKHVVKIAGEERGSRVKAAELLGISESELSQYIHAKKRMGTKKARELEKRLELPENSLDSELHDISPEALALAQDIQGLSEEDRRNIAALVKALKK